MCIIYSTPFDGNVSIGQSQPFIWFNVCNLKHVRMKHVSKSDNYIFLLFCNKAWSAYFIHRQPHVCLSYIVGRKVLFDPQHSISIWSLFCIVTSEWFNRQHNMLIIIPSDVILQDEFEDTKEVIRIRISKDRQHNDKKQTDKRTNNDLQKLHIQL